MTGSSAALAASAAAHNRTNAANFVAACVKGLRMIFSGLADRVLSDKL
jgi:hypothetical protein